MKRARKQADEYDAFSRIIRRWQIWRPGERRKIKHRVNRRERKEARDQTLQEYLEWISEIKDDDPAAGS